MEAELHDGTILEFPDGTDPQVIQATVKKMLGATTRKPFDTTLTTPEKIASAVDTGLITAGDIASKAVPRAIRPFLPDRQTLINLGAGGTQLTRNLLGIGDVGESAVDKNSGAYQAGQLLAPETLAIAGGVGKVLPYAPVIGKGFVQGAKALAGNVAGGAATGGIVGGLSDNGTVAEGAALGATLSVALPMAVASGKYIGKTVKEVADLILPGGSKRIADRYLNVIVSDANKVPLSKALSSADEIVAGSKPTAAEAVSVVPEGSPIQAHQALIAQEPGGISAEFGRRAMEQQTARDSAFSFAGTEEGVKKLITERTDAVQPLYDAVKTSTAKVKAIPVLSEVDKILKQNKNRTAIASPLSKIRDALVVKTDHGAALESNVQNLKSLSDDIGDMMGKKTPDGQHEFDVKVLNQIKEKLDNQIGLAEPAYGKAQQVFAELSKPINKMKIGQALKSKLTNPTGAETPGTYLRALDNEKKLLKESIGFGRKGIETYLSPEEMTAVGNVTKDLERQIASTHPAQKTNLRGGINVAGDTTISLPNLLSRPAMMANYVIKSLGKNVEPEIDAYFKYLYLNPKELGKVIGKVPQGQRTEFVNAIRNYGRKFVVAQSVNQASQNQQ